MQLSTVEVVPFLFNSRNFGGFCRVTLVVDIGFFLQIFFLWWQGHTNGTLSCKWTFTGDGNTQTLPPVIEFV